MLKPVVVVHFRRDVLVPGNLDYQYPILDSSLLSRLTLAEQCQAIVKRIMEKPDLEMIQLVVRDHALMERLLKYQVEEGERVGVLLGVFHANAWTVVPERFGFDIIRFIQENQHGG